MTKSVEQRSVFDLCPNDEVLIGLAKVNSALQTLCNTATVPAVPKAIQHERQRESSLLREVSDKMVCLACRCTFTNREDQVEHYKLDWHRFNLKQKMLGTSPVTAEEFEKKTGEGDVSSISGSESDSEECADSDDGNAADSEASPESCLIMGQRSTKLIFQNLAGQYLSVHRCILQGKSAESDDEQDVGSSLKNINKTTLWAILMAGGGHFVGSIFQGKEVLHHKTFHRYTVRAKRGTAQGLRDSQNRSHAPKSAGAALRRHNEAALVKDIQDLLVSWSEHLKEASAIFIRAPSYNKSIFFGSRSAPFDKKDPRIHSIPFATRRATFREAQRVHEVLSTIHVYGKDTDVSAIFSPSKKVWKKTVKHATQAKTDPDTVMAEHQVSSEEEGDEIQLKMVEVTLGTLDLRESEICPSRHQRRRRRKEGKIIQNHSSPELCDAAADGIKEDMLEAATGDETEEPSKTNKETQKPADDSVEYCLRDSLFTACKVGDVDTLHTLLQLPTQTTDMQEQSDSHSSTGSNPLSLLNEPLDSSGFTLLHVASAAAQKETVRVLMDAGADPACRDRKGQPPYIVAPDKDTRNVFRKYMAHNPDRYDYKKAQVPGPLTAELQSKHLEKKKAQKVLRKRRDKEQKEEKKKQELEAEEKKRFSCLSDREKRALAAEKRLAKQVAATAVDLTNVNRCWSCGESLLGKIPFQYSEYSFCTTRCVQAHRKANAPPGKT
ncbi:ankyrin repeat and zinc finger domain-containing protein 1 isoform X1 [Takifugu rubripes]|uniref:Ankyrin repeat and zinc finger peptidyl tRNA hydrolase 1 n=1 Tax=Takifugu rubripes TaxID=31033 RepID=H2THP4_TAKRU|nr:ankyrin repeat and zinc finger domain-containing protein 1 isoform X1 [Takifugu rubripes]